MANHALVIRRADAADLATVLGVLDHQRPSGSEPREPTDLERATWARMLGTPDLTVYVAEEDGDAVGTATLLLLPNLTYDCMPTAFVEAVVVRADRRRRGIATAIMEQLLEDARDAGCNKVQLLSHKRHATDGAHELYRRLGFAPEAEGFRRYLHEPPGG